MMRLSVIKLWRICRSSLCQTQPGRHSQATVNGHAPLSMVQFSSSLLWERVQYWIPIRNHLKMQAISCCLTWGGELKGIEPATSCSTGQHSTYWANPAIFLYSGSSHNGHSRRRTGCSTYGHLHKTPFFSTPTKLCIFTFPEAASSSFGHLFRVPRVPLARVSTVKHFSIISAIYMLIGSPRIWSE